MELERPVQLPDRSYTIPISIAEPLVLTYELKERGSHSTPEPETLAAFSRELAAIYEHYCKKWFPIPTPAVTFLARLTHQWSFGTHAPYYGAATSVKVCQTWRPERLNTTTRAFVLHWTLVSVFYDEGSGQEDETANIPFTKDEGVALVPVQRLRALRKVRAARLQAAVARARANELVARYYERYGDQELLNGDDALSSEDEV